MTDEEPPQPSPVMAVSQDNANPAPNASDEPAEKTQQPDGSPDAKSSVSFKDGGDSSASPGANRSTGELSAAATTLSVG